MRIQRKEDRHLKKEKNQKMLTEAEQRRLARFEATAAEMERQGYVRQDLTIDIGKANLVALLLLIPLFVIGYGLYFLVNREMRYTGFHAVAFLVGFLVLIVVHELIHGACWSIFAPHHFRDIEFGVLRSSLTPYCTCLSPLQKGHYIFGTVMPFLLLGILPMAAGIAAGKQWILFLGIIMADSAAGDLMIIRKLLKYTSSAEEIVYMDHPTEAGGVVFER